MPDVNFAELLGVQVESAERPRLFPAGHYDSVITGHEMGTSAQKGTPFVRFNIKLLSPGEDVDADLFEQAGGIAALNERKTIPLDFYLTKDALYRLREFLENTAGMECSGRNFDVVIPETTNAQIVVVIAHRAGQKEGEFFMNIADHARAA